MIQAMWYIHPTATGVSFSAEEGFWCRTDEVTAKEPSEKVSIVWLFAPLAIWTEQLPFLEKPAKGERRGGVEYQKIYGLTYTSVAT